ncbi:MAG: hypothetical protein IJ295_00430 [Clostridia bacterium]|nr:hypothetical protein [Clostridia bacterium]
MKKKFLSFVLAICMIIPCAFALAACQQEEPAEEATAKVMNVGLNPKIEFVLDKDDKVVSVNALNEDGNHIISVSLDADTEVSKFEGLTAEEAVELFLELTEENGYLITGNEEKISIAISGDAQKLLEKVTNKANQFLNEKGIDLEFVKVVEKALQKTDILNEVKQCVKEYSQQELEGMTEEELIELLKGSRQETKNFLTQELKDAYYNLRLEKINIAELETLYRYPQFIPSDLRSLFETAMENLNDAVAALEEAYNNAFLDTESAYNQAKQLYIEAKENLLAERLALGVDGFSEEDLAKLAVLEETATNLETALANEKAEAEGMIETVKATLDIAFNEAIKYVNIIKTSLESLVPGFDAIYENAKQNMKKGFKDYFEGHEYFKNFVDHGHWNVA